MTIIAVFQEGLAIVFHENSRLRKERKFKKRNGIAGSRRFRETCRNGSVS